MNKKLAIFSGLFAVIGIAAFLMFYTGNAGERKLDAFAQCLAARGVTMYGADWCAHCQNEKKAFSSSFQFVPYVECPANPQKCLAKGINAYPTWIFSDGKKLEGEQGIKKLSEESGCSLKLEK